MSAKTEVPWVYLCLKVQYAFPQVGARLALGLAHTWPANDGTDLTAPEATPSERGARRDTA